MFKFIEEMHIPADAEFPAYTPSEEDRDLMAFLLPRYEAYLKKAPKLLIRGESSFSLHAEERIEKGSVVVEYLGAWEPHSKTPSSYRFGPINGLNFRNFAAMAEDGFPNMAPFYLYGVGDLPLRVIFVALEEISEGEMLTFNYGPKHSVKLQEHAEYRFSQMAAFFDEHPLPLSLAKIKELHGQKRSALGFEKSLELENFTAKVQYLYQTPSALLALLLQDRLSAREVFYFWQKPDYRYYLLGVPFNPNYREQAWIDCLEMIRNYFEGERLNDRLILSGLETLRLKVVCNALLQGTWEKALLWNSALEAVKRKDRPALERLWQNTLFSEELLEECLIYAKETGFQLN